MLYLTRFDFILHQCLNKSIGIPNILSQRPDYGDGLHDKKNIVLVKPEYPVMWKIKRLAFEEEEYSLLINIYQDNKACQQEEPVAHTTRELHQLSSKLI